MTSYNLNTTEAKQAEYTGSRLDETGKYVGKFIYAEDIKAKSGAIGIEFNFEDNGGRKARLSLYTMNKDGEAIPGRKMLMAMMTCMKVKAIEPLPAKIMKYDYDEKKDVETQAHVFKDLQGKPIGLLLQSEEYPKNDGSGTGWKMNIAGCFEAATELTASEILDKKARPEQLAKMVSALKDKPLKGGAQARQGAPARQESESALEDLDVPF